MLRAVVYCRVSTKEQVQNLSLATQSKACAEYCRANDMECVTVFVEEGESAKTADRTELKKLLTYCRENRKRIDFVVVHSLSRFARVASDHHALRALLLGWGIRLRSATEAIDDTPTGKLLEGIISSIGQFDNDAKAERTKLGMREALERGRWTFQAPLGYRSGTLLGPSLVSDARSAPIIRDAFEALAEGRATKGAVMARLDASGLRSRHGRALSPQSLTAILRNPIYRGWIEVPKWGISTRGGLRRDCLG